MFPPVEPDRTRICTARVSRNGTSLASISCGGPSWIRTRTRWTTRSASPISRFRGTPTTFTPPTTLTRSPAAVLACSASRMANSGAPARTSTTTATAPRRLTWATVAKGTRSRNSRKPTANLKAQIPKPKSQPACWDLGPGVWDLGFGVWNVGFSLGPRPLVRGQDLLSQPDVLRRHLDQLIVIDELDRLLETEQARRDDADGLVRGRGAHVRLLLFLRDVDVHVALPRVLADDHAFVDRRLRLDEDLAALLEVPDRERGRDACAVGDEGAGRACGNRAVPRLPSGKEVIHDAGPFRVGEELRAEPDQPARGDAELEPDAAAAVVHHLGRHTAPRARLRDDHALKFLGHVDDQVLHRLHLHAVDLPGDNLRARDLHLVPFAAHHLDQDRQLQLAAADDLQLLGRVRVLDAQRHVAEQLLRQALAQVPRRHVLTIAPGQRRG